MPLPSRDFSAVFGELTISTSVPPRPIVGATVFRRRAGATHGWKTPGTEPHGGKRRLHCLQWLIRNGGRHSEPRGSIRSRRSGPRRRSALAAQGALRVPVGPSLRRPPRLLFVVTRQWPPRSSRDSFRRCGARRRVEHAAADADHTSCGRLRGSPSSWKSNGESQRGRKRTCPSHSPSTLHSARRIKSSIACPTGATDFTSKTPGIG